MNTCGSYPLRDIALQFGLDYGDVLLCAEIVCTRPKPRTYWQEKALERVFFTFNNEPYAAIIAHCDQVLEWRT